MSRQFNPARFIRDTVGPLLNSRTVSGNGPVLGVDEGLNDKRHMRPMTRRLVENGVVSMATPLWYQARVLPDGQRINLLGGAVSISPLMPEIGHPPHPGSSWPDEGVVAHLVAYFLQCDRLCLLTQNARNDSNGLRRILEDEVGPMLDEMKPKQLGLLALVQRPRSRLNDYCISVEHWLTTKEVEPGFRWQLVPD